ncbi:hypothetical protein Rhopal_003632-T1 [Rhodotorula paludigena]|uniref:CUE domain-containing protein n=1 Tax=Rhodotorula paludigena TaxID=86838 RepID=A0AAV5GDN7_9BASI|nr:hypothetical protein Rhopal_003632-T1 [Rhodotorula paludigena]
MDEALGWAVAAGVCYAGYKLIFGSSSSRRRRDVPQASIDQVLSVFPNVSQAAARWELERNGGSVERAPPASYFPPSPDALVVRPGTPTQAAPAAAGSSASAQAKRGPPPSLIARLGLQDKVASDDKGKAKEAEAASATGWSTSASEREKNLRARKEKLVLQARRKLLEKQARAKEASAAGPSAETSD